MTTPTPKAELRVYHAATPAALERLIVADLQRPALVSAGRERPGLKRAIGVVHQVCERVRKEAGR